LQTNYSLVNDQTQNASVVLQFEALPEELHCKSEWTDAEMQLVVSLISSNLRTLNRCVSQIVRRPIFSTVHKDIFLGKCVILYMCTGCCQCSLN
jgi:hypothetical protein